MKKLFLVISLIFLLASCSGQETPIIKNAEHSSGRVMNEESSLYLRGEETLSGSVLSHITLPIIMYHYVEEVKDRSDKGRINLSVHPAIFEGELKALKAADYTSYYVRDIPDIFSGIMKLEKNSIILTFDDGYEDFYTDVLPVLKKYQMKGTLYVINDLVNTPGYVTTAELKEIIASGLVEIGGHTLDHKNLQYADNAEATRQIVESKNRLEKDFGITLESFAYPYGGFKPHITERIVKDAGYKVAVSVDKGIVHSIDKLYTLYRLRAGMFTPQNIVHRLQQLEHKK